MHLQKLRLSVSTFKVNLLKVHAIKDGWAKVGKYQYISVDLLKVLEAKNMNIAKRKVRKKLEFLESLYNHLQYRSDSFMCFWELSVFFGKIEKCKDSLTKLVENNIFF